MYEVRLVRLILIPASSSSHLQVLFTLLSGRNRGSYLRPQCADLTGLRGRLFGTPLCQARSCFGHPGSRLLAVITAAQEKLLYVLRDFQTGPGTLGIKELGCTGS